MKNYLDLSLFKSQIIATIIISLLIILSTGNKPANAQKINYEKLSNYLTEKDWAKANQETFNLLLIIGNRQNYGWLDQKSISNLSCSELNQIDRLWVKASNGNFGFSVQAKLYPEEYGNPLTAVRMFMSTVGWNNSSQLESYPQGFFPIGYIKAGGSPFPQDNFNTFAFLLNQIQYKFKSCQLGQ